GGRRYLPDLLSDPDDPDHHRPADAARPGDPIPLIYRPTRCERIIPVATAAFSDSAWPIRGMVTRLVANSCNSGRMPFDSIPINIHPRSIRPIPYNPSPSSKAAYTGSPEPRISSPGSL